MSIKQDSQNRTFFKDGVKTTTKNYSPILQLSLI